MSKPPVGYTPEIAEKILAKLSAGLSLRGACKGDDMPTESEVRTWFDEVPGFAAQYTQARTRGYEVMAEDLLDIADDGRNDWMERNDPDNPGYVLNGENVNRSRLRVDTRKWLLAKMLPKVYGDRLGLDLAVDSELVARVFGARGRAGLKRDEQDARDLVH